MTRTVEESKLKPEKMAKALPEFIDHLFDKSRLENDPDGLKQHLAGLIKSELLQKLPQEVLFGEHPNNNNPGDLTETKGESPAELTTGDPFDA